jgi:hypothetical protein
VKREAEDRGCALAKESLTKDVSTFATALMGPAETPAPIACETPVTGPTPCSIKFKRTVDHETMTDTSVLKGEQGTSSAKKFDTHSSLMQAYESPRNTAWDHRCMYQVEHIDTWVHLRETIHCRPRLRAQ